MSILDNDDRALVEIGRWFGWSNPAKLEIIYKGTRNGFTSTAFHNCCDNKGALLFIIRLNTGHTFGGFTNQSTVVRGAYSSDTSSWLFRLYEQNNFSPKKFPLIAGKEQNALYTSCSCLAFGSGHDLIFYTDQVSHVSSYSNLGNTYNALGDNSQTALAGKYNGWIISEFEAVRVSERPAAAVPQEQFSFTGPSIEADIQSLSSYQPSCNNVPYANIIMVGGAGGGKSSFINSIASIFLNRKSNILDAFGASNGVTMKLAKIPFDKCKGGKFNFWDTMGWDKSKYVGTHLSIVSQMLDGMIKNGTSLTEEIPYNSPLLNRDPTLGDIVHCMVLIVPAPIAQADVEAYFGPFQIFLKAAIHDARKIKPFVIMTKCDDVDTSLRSTPEKTYSSPAIAKCRETIKNRTGISVDCILPVINLVTEVQWNRNTPKVKLLLIALRRILDSCEDYFLFKSFQ